MHTPIHPDRVRPPHTQNYREHWTILGPRKIRKPEKVCPGIVREGNRAIPVQNIYENAPESEG